MIGGKHLQQGYTLLELIVVMVLISMMLLISVPKFRTALISDQLQYSSRRLVGLIKGVRAKAVRDYSDYKLFFDLDTGRVWYSRVDALEDEKRENPEILQLPSGIRIRDIWSSAAGKKDGGEPFLFLSRKGYADLATIHLAEENGRTVTLFISPFMASVRIADGYLEAEATD